MIGDNENKDYLEELKRKLYSNNDKILKLKKIGTALNPKSYAVLDYWKNPKKKEEVDKKVDKILENSSMFKKFFMFSIIFFVAALTFAFFVFYRGSNVVSTENIELQVTGNAFVAGGEEITLQIDIKNKNTSALEFGELLVEYPKGSSGDVENNFERIRESIGSIDSGGIITKNIKIRLFGEQGSNKDIRITLEYRIKNSNAIFAKETKYSVTISSAPVLLSVEAPDEINSNQKIKLNTKVILNGEKTVQDMLLKADYPPGFKYESSTPLPILGNNVWKLGDLAPGMEKNIIIEGYIYGQEQEERSFNFSTGSEDPSDQSSIGVIYNTFLHNVLIKKPFIEATILVNGQNKDEYDARSQTDIEGEIAWVNNLTTRVDDVEIVAKVYGNALDKNSINPSSGFYDSANGQIVWNKNTNNTFSSIDPGDQGSINFRFSSMSLIDSSGKLLENPSITIEVSIKGKQPAEGSALQEISSSGKKIIKLSSDFQISTQALYSTGALNNSGPMPPKADQKTTYTINWTVGNSVNQITGAEARTTLPVYVKWLGNFSPKSENVTYNEGTREVYWKIGNVKRGAGYNEDKKEVSFQVELIPSLNQIGSAPLLTNETTLKGIDAFSKASLQSKKSALSTRLNNDPNFQNGDEKVVE